MDEEFDESTRDLMEVCKLKDYKNLIISSFHGPNSRNASFSEGGPKPFWVRLNYNFDAGDAKKYCEFVINRLNSLERDIWHSVEKVKEAALKGVCSLLESVNAIAEGPENLNLDPLASLFKEAEQLATSIKSKHNKLDRLRDLHLLNSMSQCNQNAISLIYNWDTTVRDIKATFRNYSQFNETATVQPTSLLLSKESDVFNLTKLQDLKNVLGSISRDTELCMYAINQRESISHTLEDFLTRYKLIVAQLCGEYIAYINENAGDGRACALPPKLLVEFYMFENDTDASAQRLFNDIVNGLTEMIKCHFKVIWVNSFDDNDMILLEFKQQGIVPVLPGQKSILPNIIDAHFKYIGGVLVRYKSFLVDIFGHLKSEYPKIDGKINLELCIAGIMEFASQDFACFDDVLEATSGDDFNIIATESFTSFKLAVEHLCEYIDYIKIKDIMSNMTLIPKSLITGYVMQLYNRSKVYSMDCTSLTNYGTFARALDPYSTVLDRLDGFNDLLADNLSVEDCKFIYALFLFGVIKRDYDIILNHLSNFVDQYFSKRETIKTFKSLNLSTHAVYKDFLLRLDRLNTQVSGALERAWSIYSKLPTDFSSLIRNSISLIDNSAPCLRELDPVLEMALAEHLEFDAIDDIFGTGKNLMHSYVSMVSTAIKDAACDYISGYLANIPSGSPTARDEDSVSPVIRMVGEYFTCLLPVYCDADVEEFRILQQGFNKFIDAELEGMAQIQTSHSKQYRSDLRFLVNIGNACNAQATESLEMLLEGSY